MDREFATIIIISLLIGGVMLGINFLENAHSLLL